MNKSSALIRAIRGPVVLITLGALTAADTFGAYSLTRTWPILLILFGLLKLAEKAAESRDFQDPGPGGYPQGPAGYPQGPAAYAGGPGQPGYQGSGAVITPVVEVVRPEPPKHD